MAVRDIQNDSWFWPLLVVLFAAAFRAGHDGLIAIYTNAFREMP